MFSEKHLNRSERRVGSRSTVRCPVPNRYGNGKNFVAEWF